LDRIFSAILANTLANTAGLKAISATVQLNGTKLDQILSILNEPSPIGGAEITFKDKMSKLTHSARGKMKFVLNDNGSATGTITLVDSVGVPTSPVSGATIATTATSSDPGVTVSVDSTGLIVTAAPAQPLPSPLPQGVVITASITITNPDSIVLGPFTCDDSADPLNVTAGGPSGAKITFA
jgi:hypothetical protein